MSSGGTLFLDEIGDMSLDLQARLLRVLASGEFYRVGGREAVVTDVRLIAATNHRLEDRVDERKFREDLLYRLNVIRMELPPLRERKTDIKNLTNYFVRTISNEINNTLIKEVKKLTKSEKIELKTNVDKSLIGGLVLQVGSTMIDSSIKTKLNSLKMTMKGV